MTCHQWLLIPAACINILNPPATTPNATTLPNQITTSHPSRLYQGARSQESMIAIANPHFAAKHVVAPDRVHQDDRQNKQRADQDEQLAGWR